MNLVLFPQDLSSLSIDIWMIKRIMFYVLILF